jgi:transketolase
MLNPDAKLNPNLFDDDVAQAPTRDGFGEGLVAAGDANRNVVALCADLTGIHARAGVRQKISRAILRAGRCRAEHGDGRRRAGRKSGKIPFIASYATFSPGRNWEQIRTTIAYNDANVKIAGHHAGISVGPDGATHQATEDIAIMRAMPNMKVLVPCDAIEARKATLASAQIYGPIYLRFQRERTPIMTTDETPFVPGKAEIFWVSKKTGGAHHRLRGIAL